MKRVLLKLSGEALAGEKKTGFDEAVVLEVARQVKILVDEGIQATHTFFKTGKKLHKKYRVWQQKEKFTV